MYQHILRLCLSIILLFTSQLTQALVISSTDWHLTTDGFGGLKQSQLSEDIYFAVSSSNVFNDTATYEMLDGYHWATSDEYMALIGESMSAQLAYYGHGGWSGYNWEGLTRYQFFFADTVETHRIQHAGNFEYSRWVREITYHTTYGNNYFGGFVLVKDAQSVTEPSTLLLMVLGLAGLGFVKKRKNKNRLSA